MLSTQDDILKYFFSYFSQETKKTTSHSWSKPPRFHNILIPPKDQMGQNEK